MKLHKVTEVTTTLCICNNWIPTRNDLRGIHASDIKFARYLTSENKRIEYAIRLYVRNAYSSLNYYVSKCGNNLSHHVHATRDDKKTGRSCPPADRNRWYYCLILWGRRRFNFIDEHSKCAINVSNLSAL